MSVTLKDVEHIAKLARLSFSEGEKQKLTSELNDVLKYMDHLNSLDVEPLSRVIEPDNILRDDVVKPCVDRADALKNAPARTDKFFKVPKVIGNR